MGINDVVKMQIIGNYVEIVDAKNKKLVRMKGKIIDETRNMIKIESEGQEKLIIKEQVVLNIHKNGKIYQVSGKKLIGRTEERVKNES